MIFWSLDALNAGTLTQCTNSTLSHIQFLAPKLDSPEHGQLHSQRQQGELNGVWQEGIAKQLFPLRNKTSQRRHEGAYCNRTRT